MISTRNLSRLPEPAILKQLTKSLAMLDAVIQREWDYRYYSFNSKWADYGEMASMRNGQGDEWFCVFGSGGVFLKGFDHESNMSPWTNDPPRVWPGVVDSVPTIFEPCVSEPAFSIRDTTYCIWRGLQDTQWKTGTILYPEGEDPDGSGWMLSILDGKPGTYKAWAEGYYERPVSLSAVEKIYAHIPLTQELAREFNATVEFETVLVDAAEIDYPTARTKNSS